VAVQAAPSSAVERGPRLSGGPQARPFEPRVRPPQADEQVALSRGPRSDDRPRSAERELSRATEGSGGLSEKLGRTD